jgi:nucleotide-binding universal stress UspA family protein
MGDSTDRPVLVGVDGSEPSQHALEWAADEAERRGAPLECLTAWTWPTAYGWASVVPEGLDPAGDAGRVLGEQLAPVRTAHPDLEVRAEVVEGRPDQALVEASRAAVLLVVGSRGHGGFTDMLIGSTSRYCAAHAHCTVVVHR